jgi:hypothetical protein
VVAAEGSAAPGTEASVVSSESSTSEHDNSKIAHTSSSETEKETGSELVSNGHGTSDNGNTHTADGESVAVAVGAGVEENVPAGDVLTAEEADKAWEQYLVQVRTLLTARSVRTARLVRTLMSLQSQSHHYIS